MRNGSASSVTEEQSVEVSLTVQNTGSTYAAHDTVLLFLFDMVRRVTPEYKLLKRYAQHYWRCCSTLNFFRLLC